MDFKYNYINIPFLLVLYPLHKKENWLTGFKAEIGIQVGLPLTLDNIVYHSGGTGLLPDFGSGLEQQQQLRNVLKGKTNFGCILGLGFHIPGTEMWVDLRHFFGFTDITETLSNSYNFTENYNVNNAWQLTVDFNIASISKAYRSSFCPILGKFKLRMWGRVCVVLF